MKKGKKNITIIFGGRKVRCYLAAATLGKYLDFYTCSIHIHR